MDKRETASYGSWASPITSDLIVKDTIQFGQIALDGTTVYWEEGRPSEDGRIVIVRWQAGERTDMTPPGYNVRTRVHEYGGGSFTQHNGALYFSNFNDQRLYRHYPGQPPEAVTPAGAWRFADGIITPTGQMICIREDHGQSSRQDSSGQDAINTIVRLRLDGEDSGQILVSGSDFYASPRLSPDGTQLVWLAWDHPNMPWDGTELWLADVTDEGYLENKRQIAGGVAESIFQPSWSPDGVLHFVSDKTGWWNLYRWQEGKIDPLYPLEAEFGRPQWMLGLNTYDFESADSIICTYTQNGTWRLARLNTSKKELTQIPVPYTTIADRSTLQVGAGYALFTGGTAATSPAMVRLNLQTHHIEEIHHASTINIDPGYLSIPEPIEFPTENGLMAHAFYYPPKNQDFIAPEGEAPPLIVISHGGPTTATNTLLSWRIQYWTSRGFGVVDVNYSGSTGYGRAYQTRLRGQWGIVDVADCINAAYYLVKQGRADEDRLAIRGGSAGGYTTLCALTFYDTFSAGASHYGISDLEGIAKESHKFESRYLDNLIGPYPERLDIYRERSPLYFVENIACPLILFQGLEDKVVPPNQSEKMFEAVKANGFPVAYMAFEGEQHGFRRAENIKRALDSELYFYSKVFGFDLPTFIEPVTIENLNHH